MRLRPLIALAVLAAVAPPALLAQAETGESPNAALRCVAPTDAAGIDAILAEAGSPLAGEGATFVGVGQATGIDPRALVAIAAHETILETYGPAQAINNPFGLGPGWAFPTEADAIAKAGEVLASFYLAEGRETLGPIGAKWAPIGVANDPTNLNAHWQAGVATYYAALGGDPATTIRLADQPAAPTCGAVAASTGQPVVWAWDGRPAAVTGPRMRDGADPRNGLPAELTDFVFPLAAPAGQPVGYSDPGPGWDAGSLASLVTAPETLAVAAIAGRLRAGTAPEQERGIAFWIEAGVDRVAYGPLAAYEPGIAAGAEVRPGQVLGATTGQLAIGWERDGSPVNPYPLLAATLPPA